MFRLDLGASKNYCDGLSRRSFLTLGAAGLAKLGLPGLLAARESAIRSTAHNRSVILFWLDGGPSHLDLYDMKPDAPAEYRGMWRPIRTHVPGFDISELFPRQARVTERFSVVRSLHHDGGGHFGGAHYMITGKNLISGTAQQFPGIGAVITHTVGARRPGMPAYVVTPSVPNDYFDGHMLGAHANPFQPRVDPNQPGYAVSDFNLAAGLSLPRLEERRSLVRHFDTARRDLDTRGTALAMDRLSQQAFDFVTGPTARVAFDISREDPRLRDRYGRNFWGQSTLLARRLVEAGSRFVSLNFGGWDHHWTLREGMEDFLPKLDMAVATLFEDLHDRGLADQVLVVVCGEFSRTPRMNDGHGKGTPGRDHWSDSMFCLLGGGGVKGGQVIGSTDRLGTRPNSRPVSPANIHATIFRVLGLDPRLQLIDPSGRPINVLDDPTPIHELI